MRRCAILSLTSLLMTAGSMFSQERELPLSEAIRLRLRITEMPTSLNLISRRPSGSSLRRRRSDIHRSQRISLARETLHLQALRTNRESSGRSMGSQFRIKTPRSNSQPALPDTPSTKSRSRLHSFIRLASQFRSSDSK